jgi:phage tail-like protein
MSDPLLGELFNSLPTPLRNDRALADFLIAFERVLLGEGLGSADRSKEGLEERIDRLAEAIDPMRAELDDVRWIAGWMGLAIDADYPTANEQQYRSFVAQTMERYRQRGTLAGMAALLQQFTGKPSNIWNDDKPHCFIVSLELGDVHRPNEIERLTRVARALIEREKPAHTRYELRPRFPSFQVADLEAKDGRLQPRQGAHIERAAQIGGRDDDGNIKVGNMMLGQASSN